MNGWICFAVIMVVYAILGISIWIMHDVSREGR